MDQKSDHKVKDSHLLLGQFGSWSRGLVAPMVVAVTLPTMLSKAGNGSHLKLNMKKYTYISKGETKLTGPATVLNNSSGRLRTDLWIWFRLNNLQR
jgi:hypothetical protein